MANGEVEGGGPAGLRRFLSHADMRERYMRETGIKAEIDRRLGFQLGCFRDEIQKRLIAPVTKEFDALKPNDNVLAFLSDKTQKMESDIKNAARAIVDGCKPFVFTARADAHNPIMKPGLGPGLGPGPGPTRFNGPRPGPGRGPGRGQEESSRAARVFGISRTDTTVATSQAVSEAMRAYQGLVERTLVRINKVPPPNVTRIDHPPRALFGERVRIVAHIDSQATGAVLAALGPGGERGFAPRVTRTWTMKRAGNGWAAELIAEVSARYSVTGFIGDRNGAPKRFSIDVLPDHKPLMCPTFPGPENEWTVGNLWYGSEGNDSPIPKNLRRWNPEPAKADACRYVKEFGEGAEGGVATTPDNCCRFAVKMDGFDVPIRNARVRLYHWYGPFPIESADLRTDDTGFIDLSAFLKGATGYSADILSEYGALTLVNGLKGGAVYKQTINNLATNDRLRYVEGEPWAFAYGNRLMAAHAVLARLLGAEWVTAIGADKIRVNWDHLAPGTASALPFPGGPEVILKPGGKGYGLSDAVVREELAHAVHFRALGREPELLGRYALFLLESATRKQIVELLRLKIDPSNTQILDSPPGNERPPPPEATRVRDRSMLPQMKSCKDLKFSTSGQHTPYLLTSEIVAYVEAFGTLAGHGFFEDSEQGSLLERRRKKILDSECRADDDKPRVFPAGVERIDTLMSADKVIKSEGHLGILLFGDFPRLARISLGEVFGLMKRSKALTFREFARYVKEYAAGYWRALSQAAARKNIVLEKLVLRIGN